LKQTYKLVELVLVALTVTVSDPVRSALIEEQSASVKEAMV
jgi:hypothetical protein